MTIICDLKIYPIASEPNHFNFFFALQPLPIGQLFKFYDILTRLRCLLLSEYIQRLSVVCLILDGSVVCVPSAAVAVCLGGGVCLGGVWQGGVCLGGSVCRGGV